MRLVLKFSPRYCSASVPWCYASYGILLIGAAASGSSDTEPAALVGTGALCLVVALVPGWLAWRLLRSFYRCGA